ncbi:glycosyltransferase family 2 protein, partial [Escherichia coli]|nr:glycosyltransferase family 2 protein [Escherichia coli]
MLNYKPLVSVLIPVYNAEKYIERSLNSIINQTYKNLEIIIINDGSTDRTLDIIRTFTEKRITVVNNE